MALWKQGEQQQRSLYSWMGVCWAACRCGLASGSADLAGYVSWADVYGLSKITLCFILGSSGRLTLRPRGENLLWAALVEGKPHCCQSHWGNKSVLHESRSWTKPIQGCHTPSARTLITHTHILPPVSHICTEAHLYSVTLGPERSL